MNNFLANIYKQKLQSSRELQQISSQISSKKLETAADSLKNKVRLQIEKRFNESIPNKTYVFPRKRAFSKDSRDFSEDSSLDSIKAVFLYDLREQNKKTLANGLKTSFSQNFKQKTEKFIKGKYQILKGKSLLHGENSYNSLEFSQTNLNKNKESFVRKAKNINGSADLRENSENVRKPLHSNPLYQLTKSNLVGKRKVFKGLSTNFAENLKKMRSFNQFSSTFLEINSLKINLPEIKSTNSFKVTATSSKKK